MSETETPHLDENVSFTQITATTWEVWTSGDITVGRVEKDGGTFTAFDAQDQKIGEYPTAESGMFALVTGPVTLTTPPDAHPDTSRTLP